MRKLCFILLLLIIPASLFAQDDDWRNRRARRDRYTRDNSFELTPFIGYRYGGTLYADTSDLFNANVDIASHFNYGVNFGIPIADGFKVELMVNRQDTHFQAGDGLFSPNENLGDFHITYYQAGVVIPFAQSRNATPFFVVSAGVANLDPDFRGVSAENRFSASAGIGVKVPINRGAGIRFEARGYYTSLGSSRDDCFRCTSFNSNHDLYQGETNLGVYLKF